MAHFKTVSLNMQFGQNWDPEQPDEAPVDLDRTAGELIKHDADIILLQEVERVNPERGQIQPPPNFTILERALPHYNGYFHYPSHDERELPFGFGLAIFSKTPLFDLSRVDLPAPPITFKLNLPKPLGEFKLNGTDVSPTDRLLIGAKTTIEGVDIQIFNTHLQAFFMIDLSSDNYPEQREIVAEQLRNSKIPTILGGDFNVVPRESTVEHLESTGYKTAQKETITWKRMPLILDHIFYHPSLHLDSSAVHDTTASDHQVLEAVFST